MKKAALRLNLILKWFLFAGFSVRILCGAVWMCLQFGKTQAFEEVEEGIYPLLAGSLGQIPQILYLLQLAAAFWAGWALVGAVRPVGKFLRCWCAAALMTVPMAMQCHMAILPYSFVSSLSVLELACCLKVQKDGQNISLRHLAAAGCCFVGLTLLLPEYCLLGAVPIAVTLILKRKALLEDTGRLLYACLLMAAFCGAAGGICGLAREGEPDFQERFWASAAARTAWPVLLKDYEEWPEELRLADDEVLREVTRYPENMKSIFLPVYKEAAGGENAVSCYREMAGISWQRHRTQILKQIVWDVLIYGATEAVLPLQLKGRSYDSHSGVNYGMLTMEHPLFTKYYVWYSCLWFWASLGAAALLKSLRVFRRGPRKNAGASAVKGFLITAVSWLGAVVLYYTMQGAGTADYKYTAAAAVLWAVPSLLEMTGGPEEHTAESVAELKAMR